MPVEPFDADGRPSVGLELALDVVDELLDEGAGLVGEGLSVLDGEPAAAAGIQQGLGDDGVRGQGAVHRLPAAAAGGLVLGGHRSAGRMPLMMAQ